MTLIASRPKPPPEFRDDVRSSPAKSLRVVINAIRAFLLDQRLIILGAQSLETFREAFAQLAP